MRELHDTHSSGAISDFEMNELQGALASGMCWSIGICSNIINNTLDPNASNGIITSNNGSGNKDQLKVKQFPINDASIRKDKKPSRETALMKPISKLAGVFPLFGNLPMEIQLKILKYYTMARVIPIVKLSDTSFSLAPSIDCIRGLLFDRKIFKEEIENTHVAAFAGGDYFAKAILFNANTAVLYLRGKPQSQPYVAR